MMRLQKWIQPCLLAVTALGVGVQCQAQADLGSHELSGSLYFERNEPLEANQVMTVDLNSGQLAIAADGSDGSTWGRDIAFLQLCSPLAVRLSVTDADGFINPISECFERDVITPDLIEPAISPDGRFVAVTNLSVPGGETSDDPLKNLVLSRQTYAATHVYNRDGEIVGEFRGMGPSTWTKDGQLILAGLQEDPGFGIYRASSDFVGADRIDDGRLNAAIAAMDAHPSENRITFIFNSQLWDMALSDGKPKRLHSHGSPIGGLAYSPDGDTIAFVSVDALEEAYTTPKKGYHIWFYSDGEKFDVTLPIIPAGKLDWVE